MKLETITPNYCITVVKIEKTNKLEGLDNLVGVNLFGYNALTSKEINLDELHLFVTAETQLSDAFCSQNNLYSSAEANIDKTKKGYIGKNGRIRAVKLRGNTSNAILMPLSSLSYLGINYSKLNEGDTFNNINGEYICNKYVIPIPSSLEGKNKTRGKTKKYQRIDGTGFPEHFDTDNYFRNAHKYKDEDLVIITQKLHGTSCRLANVKVNIKPTFVDKLLRRQRTKYDYLAGSRRVIKDLKSEREFEHFYEYKKGELDIYNFTLEKYQSCIPKDTIIYGEVVGYTLNGGAIQKDYTYDCLPGQSEFYIYRIVTINSDGQTVDYSREAIKEFCKNTGMKCVPEMAQGILFKININEFMDGKYLSDGFDGCLPLSDTASVDEGVCIRREGITPYVTKAKSPLFYEWETALLDEGVVDLESNQE